MERGLVKLSAVAALAIATAAGACAPVQTYSGFRSNRNDVEIPDPQVGVDTRDTVRQRFGSPSTEAVFDTTAWYYVSSTQERIAFYQPRITQRHVMVVRFNGDTVAAVEKFGLERGRVVSYNDDFTPTRGRELSVLEQLLGSIGNTPPIRTQDEEQGGRPNRR